LESAVVKESADQIQEEAGDLVISASLIPSRLKTCTCLLDPVTTCYEREREGDMGVTKRQTGRDMKRVEERERERELYVKEQKMK
jgi:hypothetical protein